MNAPNLYRVLNINDYSATPKYLQISNAIIQGIETLPLEEGYLLPSINEMSYELDISRDTVEKAYRRLKQMGIVGSVPGKGFFIAKTDFKQQYRVLLMFNKLSAHKKIIYDEFAATLGSQAAIDFFIYNNDFSLFKSIIEQHRDGYTHYVIIPHFLEGGEKAAEVISQLNDGRLILLDKLVEDLRVPFGAVYEDFENDLFKALSEAYPRLQGYRRLNILFPSNSYFPLEILKGFSRFCQHHQFEHQVLNDVQQASIAAGEVFINLMEDDLVLLLERIQDTNLQVGQDVGIISYNETPWKRFILQGVTTISTDFRMMGQMAATMILEGKAGQQSVPFHLTLRSSL